MQIIVAGNLSECVDLAEALRSAGHGVTVSSLPHLSPGVSTDVVIFKGEPSTVGLQMAELNLPLCTRRVAYVAANGIPVLGNGVPLLKQADLVVAANNFTANAIAGRLGQTPAVAPVPITLPELTDRWGESAPATFTVSAVTKGADDEVARLLKVWRAFILPWAACGNCGAVSHLESDGMPTSCGVCGHSDIRTGAAKTNAKLQLVTWWDQSSRMIDHLGLQSSVELIHWTNYRMDAELRLRVLRDADVFVSASGRHRWCGDILAAMSHATPVLVPQYGPCIEIASMAAEMIEVTDFRTDPNTLAEHGLVNIEDMVMKLDRFYYEADTFIPKWGRRLVDDTENLSRFAYGLRFRRESMRLSRGRAEMYASEITGRHWTMLLSDMWRRVHGDG